MELHHRLIRQTINIAISKATDDISLNAKRGVRNLIDLGQLFAKSDTQRWFFDTAKKVIANPNNLYNRLASKIVENVDRETIKTAGINLGYSSLIYGAKKIKQQQALSDYSIPWFLIFEDIKNFEWIRGLIRQGREVGIYSYLFRVKHSEEIPLVIDEARLNNECVFLLEAPAAAVTSHNAELLKDSHNIMVSVNAEHSDIADPQHQNAFTLLRRSRCLYGINTHYTEENIRDVVAEEYIRLASELGNLFCVYRAGGSASEACREAAHTFVNSKRVGDGEPVVPFEWSCDMRSISEKILCRGGCMAINSLDKVCDEYKKMKGTVECTLLEIIRGLALCPNV